MRSSERSEPISPMGDAQDHQDMREDEEDLLGEEEFEGSEEAKELPNVIPKCHKKPTVSEIVAHSRSHRPYTMPLNGSSRVRVKHKPHRKQKGACKSSWSQIGNLKSFTLTIPWNLEKPEDLSWNHCTSTPHRSETNGIAERAVRRVKEGTSAVLLQSGLNGSWWADSMECYTYLRNDTDLLSDGKTPYERRFGQPF